MTAAAHTLSVTIGVRWWFMPAITAIGWVFVRVFRRRPPEWLCGLVVKRAVYVVRR